VAQRATLASAAVAALLFAPGPAFANATADAFDTSPFALAADGFNELTSARITTQQLAAGLAGNAPLGIAVGGGLFRRTTGTAYPATQGLYSFSGGPSTFEMAVADAADGLVQIRFQSLINISLSSGVDGLLEPAFLPRLSWNGGQQFLAATTQVSRSVAAGFDFFTGEPITPSPDNPNHQTFTWDLSSVGSTIESFKLTWATDLHANALAYQVEQIGAIPEPSTWLMAALGLALAGRHVWRGRRVRPAGAR
jgi:hypothetical protein